MFIVKGLKKLFSKRMLLLFLRLLKPFQVNKNGLNGSHSAYPIHSFFNFCSSSNQVALLVTHFAIFCSFE